VFIKYILFFTIYGSEMPGVGMYNTANAISLTKEITLSSWCCDFPKLHIHDPIPINNYYMISISLMTFPFPHQPYPISAVSVSTRIALGIVDN
jgi:hypothetical protein